MLEKIILKNFKCYREQEINFSKLTVLCGGNSVGKSAIIQSIAAIIQSNEAKKLDLNGELVKLGGYKDIHSKFDDISPCTYIELYKNEQYYKWGITKNLDEIDIDYLPLIEGDLTNLKIENEKLNKSYQFLIAERIGPRDNFPYSPFLPHKNWLGIRGEFTSQVLSELSQSSLSFSQLEYLNSTIEKNFSNKVDSINIISDPRIHINEPYSNVIYRHVQHWINEITPEIRVTSHSIKDALISYTTFNVNGNLTRPSHVGFGLSYSLSIILALLTAPKNGVVIIENPEAHLHPRGQSYLGRLIALTAKAGVQVIVETHSEHIINGIRVAICLSENFVENWVKVLFLHRENGTFSPRVKELDFDENAQLPCWPTGFFDQQMKDIDILMRKRL